MNDKLEWTINKWMRSDEMIKFYVKDKLINERIIDKWKKEL